jgi:AcrR family transcriptional regulator
LNRSESKYYATAARMDEAFLELLEKKDFAYITVKEICEKAGVNRSTFYLHYETINDLLEESAQHIIDQFVEAMPHDAPEFFEKMQTRPLEELFLITPEYLIPYLNYVKEHRSIFRTALEHASTLRLNDAYLALNHHVFSPILNRFHITASEQKYMMPFYINGLMGIVNEWLKEDCKDSVEHIVSVMRICITNHER